MTANHMETVDEMVVPEMNEESPGPKIVAGPVPLSILVLSILSQNRRLLAWFLGAGLILSTAIAFLIPSQYKSTVELMPPGWQSSNDRLSQPFLGVSLMSAGGANLSGGILNSRSPAGPILGIIASRTMEDDLISRFDLQRVYRARYPADARKILERRTDASEDRPTGIISIVVSDHDPTRARDIAAAYIDELNKLVVTMDTSSSHKERLFLEQRLKEVQADLESSEQQLGGFSSRTGTLDTATQSKAMLDAVSSVQGQLIAAQSELRGLQAVYSDENALVKQAKARVATLSGELQKLEGVRGSGNSQPDADQAFPSLRQLPLLGATYADLYRRTRTLEVAYELLSRELEAAKIEEAEQIPSVKVLDPPVIAQKKSFPPRILIIVAGVFLALLSGTSWVIGHEVWQQIESSATVKLAAKEATSFFRLKRRES
jgi:capsule polysaccharide export protein KpsE/RkpR